MPLIARFVFGRYWRAAAPAQRQELTETFQDYLIARYSDRLSAYADSGRTPVVTGCRPVDGGVLVNSEVVLGRSPTQGGRGAALPPLTVGWRLVEEDGGYKIADVVVDGISMAITQRAEFADEIQREGGQLPALVAILREQTGSTAAKPAGLAGGGERRGRSSNAQHRQRRQETGKTAGHECEQIVAGQRAHGACSEGGNGAADLRDAVVGAIGDQMGVDQPVGRQPADRKAAGQQPEIRRMRRSRQGAERHRKRVAAMPDRSRLTTAGFDDGRVLRPPGFTTAGARRVRRAAPRSRPRFWRRARRRRAGRSPGCRSAR